MRRPHPVELVVPLQQPGQVDPGSPDIAETHPVGLQPKPGVGEHLVGLGRGIPGQRASGFQPANRWQVQHAKAVARPEPAGPRRGVRDCRNSGLVVAGHNSPDLQANKLAFLQGSALDPRDRHAQVQFLLPVGCLALLQYGSSGTRQAIDPLLNRLDSPFGHCFGHLRQQLVSPVLVPPDRSGHMIFRE